MLHSSPEKISLFSKSFQALSEPLRLKIISLLQQQELCVCDLCDNLKVAQPKLSFHLKILKEAKLITSRQQGRWVYYKINPEQFQILEQHLNHYALAKPESARLCQN
jgi:ArsR family transcriptional regulator